MMRWTVITFVNTTCLPHRNRRTRISFLREGRYTDPPLIPHARLPILCCVLCAKMIWRFLYLLHRINRKRRKLRTTCMRILAPDLRGENYSNSFTSRKFCRNLLVLKIELKSTQLFFFLFFLFIYEI